MILSIDVPSLITYFPSPTAFTKGLQLENASDSFTILADISILCLSHSHITRDVMKEINRISTAQQLHLTNTL